MYVHSRLPTRLTDYLLPLLIVLLATGSIWNTRSAHAATVVLYQNDFESPLVSLTPNCAKDLDSGSVNQHYGPEFQQQNTVETLLIHGPNHQYSDPSGTGGNYALGMLSTINDDKIALTFNSQGHSFINVQLDISAIDLNGCGGPFGVTTPVFKLSLVDSPGGSFSFNSSAILDSTTITGVAPSGSYTFHWANRIAGLSTTGTTDGKVTLVIDLLQSGYAALDNLVIVASDTSGVVDADLDGVSDANDMCSGTTVGLAVDSTGCPTVAAIVGASNSPADGGYDQDDLTGAGLIHIVSSNLADYESAIATAAPVPTTQADLQAIIDQVNGSVSNNAPIANAQTVNGTEDSDLSITLSGSDQDGDTLSYVITSLPTVGTLYQASSGTRGAAITSVPTTVSDASHRVIFVPAANGNGTPYATFAFKVNDSLVDSSAASVTVSITSVNDAPAATNGSFTTAEDTVLSGNLSASDAEGDQLMYSLVTDGSKGSVTIADNTGAFTYTPQPNTVGIDSFTFKVNDGTANSNVAAISITITSVNDSPTLNTIDDVSVLENAPLTTVALNGISAGPANETGQVVSITAVSSNPALVPNPQVSYTSPNTTASLSFTPAADMIGTATITVTVSDNGSGSAPNSNTFVQTFVVFVGPVNHRPTLAVLPDVTLLEDAGQQTISLSGISVGSFDETKQSLLVATTSSNPSLIPAPIINYASPNSTGSLSFTPIANGNGTATITVTVQDNGGTADGGIDTLVRVFKVTVTPVNDAPSFVPGSNQVVG